MKPVQITPAHQLNDKARPVRALSHLEIGYRDLITRSIGRACHPGSMLRDTQAITQGRS